MKITRYLGVGDVSIPPQAKKNISQVLATRRITYGPFTNRFERGFAQLHNLRFAVFCNSGTSALQVALHILKKKYYWNDGDEVLVPALTFVATVNIVLQNNMRPVFVDVEQKYFAIDPQEIEKKITKKTRAIIPVHVGGMPCDMDPIMAIARKHKLKVIEDSCETICATYKGKSVGTFGDMSCFSTYAAHTLVTGVGGFICTNKSDLAVKAKSLVNHGRDGIYISIDDDNVTEDKELFTIVDRRFRFTDVGYSYRGTEFESALGLAQLASIRENITTRQRNATRFLKGLTDLERYMELPQDRPNARHTYMFFPILLKKTVSRRKLVHFLEKHNIETRFLLPLLNQPVYRKLFGNIDASYPTASYVASYGFYVGCHPGLLLRDIDYIIEVFHDYFRLAERAR